ncbi:MAG TPA: hypothetical protein VGJ75_19595, partial [Dongiaceae bacterium]
MSDGLPILRPAGHHRKLLRMVGQVLVAQAPILPKLKRTQQDNDCTEGDMPGPKYVVTGVAEDER